MQRKNVFISISWRRAIPAAAGFMFLFLHAPSRVEAAWYSAGAGRYQYRKLITIDHTKVSGSSSLSNFAVLISTTDADLKTTANGGKVTNSSGYDIIFSSADGITKLDHEIDTYTATTGKYNAWVRIPVLSRTVDTSIYIYFGNSSISTSQENATGVWDTNYKGVWHLKETTGAPSKNSTGGSDATPVNSPVQITGQIDGGLSFNGAANGMEDNISSTFGLGTANVTMETWANLSAASLSGAFIKIGDTGSPAPGNGYAIGVGNGLVFETAGSRITALYEGNRWINAGAFTTGWHHFVLVVDGSGHPIVYYDGSSIYTDASPGPLAPVNITHIGGYTASASENRHFNGILDEVRISATVRSADWIKTEYNNQSSPSTFFSVQALDHDTSAFFQLFE